MWVFAADFFSDPAFSLPWLYERTSKRSPPPPPPPCYFLLILDVWWRHLFYPIKPNFPHLLIFLLMASLKRKEKNGSLVLPPDIHTHVCTSSYTKHAWIHARVHAYLNISVLWLLSCWETEIFVLTHKFQIMALFYLLLLVITNITLLFIGKIQRAEFGREWYYKF